MAGAALAVVALARWLQAEDGPSLVAAALGLLVAVATVGRLRRPRGWAVGAIAALAITLGIATAETRGRVVLAGAGEQWAIAARNEDVARVGAGIARALREAERAATLAAATGIAGVPVVDGAETGVVVFDGARPIARAGQARVRLGAGPPGVWLERTAFYDALVVRVEVERTAPSAPAVAGEATVRSAVATVLLTAAPPADRVARALVPHLTSAEIAPSIRLDVPALIDGLDAADPMGRVVTAGPDSIAVLVVSATPRGLDEARLSALQRARVRIVPPLAVAALLVLVVAWRRPARLGERVGTVAVLLVAIGLAPLGALSNVSPLFNAANYFSPIGGPFTANIAALTLTALLALLVLFRVLRSTRFAESRRLALALVIAVAALGPFALRDLARGIAFPPTGPSVGLWIAWQLALALAAAGTLLAVASAGQVVLGARRGLPAPLGPGIAAGAALFAPVFWDVPGAWPVWYPVPWIAAIVALAFVRRGRALVTAVAVVAGCGAVTLTWGATTRTRMQLAERDIARLGAVDREASELLARFAEALLLEGAVPDRARLLQRYASADLARAGYPAVLARWSAETPFRPIDLLELATLEDPLDVPGAMAAMVRGARDFEIRATDDGPFSVLVAAIPLGADTVVTVTVPPRTWLLPADPFARFAGLGVNAERAPPYTLSLGAPLAALDDAEEARVVWRRAGHVMQGDANLTGGGERRRAHVDVDLRSLDVLATRGALLVLLDVGVILLVSAASAMADGGLGRSLRWQRLRWRRSYRVRLSVALLGFFLAPAAAFSLWETYRVGDDDRNARELLVREALRPIGSLEDARGLLTTEALARVAEATGGPLFAFRDGVLTQASDPVLAELAPLGALLPTDVPVGATSTRRRLDEAEPLVYTRPLTLAARTGLVGYRPLVGPEGQPLVLAAAARGDEVGLAARRADLAVLVLLVTVSGVLAALWLSGAAARQLARPIGTLRDAALAIADGRAPPPLDALPPAEFVPVFGAFARMATDLAASRAALEEAQRRTAAVLREVASGVVAVRGNGTVLLANPRAATLLGVPLSPGTPLLPAHEGPLQPPWSALVPRLRTFLADPERGVDAFDVPPHPGGHQLRASLTRLSGGAVLTLDDVTELATAQRVLAWGEMARQVAHEIKNPLTPIRLGVQHLRRAWRDGRADFGQILDTNVTRILAEIDHLDEIARAFSRYGSAPAERAPAEPVDVARIAADVMALERLGEGQIAWTLSVEERAWTGAPAAEGDAAAEWPTLYAMARADELREVILNLLENARLAEAHAVCCSVRREGGTVVVEVRDDGVGMEPEVRHQIFQPHFSTRTSGSGLGLAISRRLLEGWGGTIDVRSEPGAGSTFTVTLRGASAPD